MNKRLAPRQRTYLGAYASSPDWPSIFKCLVRNVTETGARLRFETAYNGPDEFELHIPQLKATRQVRLVWRNEDEAGVTFLTPVKRMLTTGSGETRCDLT